MIIFVKGTVQSKPRVMWNITVLQEERLSQHLGLVYDVGLALSAQAHYFEAGGLLLFCLTHMISIFLFSLILFHCGRWLHKCCLNANNIEGNFNQ